MSETLLNKGGENPPTIQLTTLYMDKPKETKRQKCEVFARVVGYMRPVEQWNAGKAAEYGDRKTFKAKQ